MMTSPIDNGLNNNNMPTSNQDLGQGVLTTGISKSALRWIVASLSIILFVTILCLSYSIGVGDAQNGAIPIIRADGTAIKIRPDNPGGRKYPHQDLTIYNSFRDDISHKNNQLRNDSGKPTALKLTSEEKTENVNNTLFSDNQNNLVTVSEPQKEKNINNPIPNTVPKFNMPTENTEAEIKKIVTESNPPVTLVTKAEIPNKIITPVVNKPQEQTQSPVTSNVTPRAYLQIGAYRSEADALVGFNKAKTKFTQLTGAGHNIVKADLGAKGIYYRLRIGPFANKQDSMNICHQLQAKGQACLFISQ